MTMWTSRFRRIIQKLIEVLIFPITSNFCPNNLILSRDLVPLKWDSLSGSCTSDAVGGNRWSSFQQKTEEYLVTGSVLKDTLA
jgi:hypothetical protein